MKTIAGLVNLLPAVVNTVGSLFKNKKNSNDKSKALLPALMKDEHGIADGLELSSKVVGGFGLGGYIIYYALSHEPLNLYVLIIGASIVVATIVVKVFEK